MFYTPQDPYIYHQASPNLFQMYEELQRLKFEIAKIKEKIETFESTNKNDYLKNDDNFYIM